MTYDPLPPHILADALQDRCEHIGEGRFLRATPIHTKPTEAMTTEKTAEPIPPTTRTRTDWSEALFRACQEYEHATGRTVTASALIFPSSPGIHVRVDDELPRSFLTAKDAAIAVRIWTHAPGAARGAK